MGTAAIAVSVEDPSVANADAVSAKAKTTMTTGNVLTNDVDASKTYDRQCAGRARRHGHQGRQRDFTYTPPLIVIGEDRFTYTFADGIGTTAAGTETVTVTVEYPPVANDDAASVKADIPGDYR